MHAPPYRQLPARLIALILSAAICPIHAAAPTPAPPSAAEALRAAMAVERLAEARSADAAAQAISREKMRAIYLDLATRYPADPDIKSAFGDFLWRQGQHPEAFAQWQAAETLRPKNGPLLSRMGDAFLAEGNSAQAAHYFESACDAAPEVALYHFNLANVYFVFRHDLPMTEKQAFEKALAHFESAGRLAPLNAPYARAYAETFYLLPSPDWKTALGAWERLETFSDYTDFARVNRARVLINLGRFEETRAVLMKVKKSEFTRVRDRLLERVSEAERGARP